MRVALDFAADVVGLSSLVGPKGSSVGLVYSELHSAPRFRALGDLVPSNKRAAASYSWQL